jgi:hypothetical protein
MIKILLKIIKINNFQPLLEIDKKILNKFKQINIKVLSKVKVDKLMF